HVHGLIGTNSRLDALQAAALAAKLVRLDGWNRARRAAVASYRRLLDSAIPAVRVADEVESSYHQYVVRVPDRDLVQGALSCKGIQTGIHYRIPCHLQDPYRPFAPEPLPVVEQAAGEILSLPLFPHLTAWQVEYVADSLNELIRGEASG